MTGLDAGGIGRTIGVRGFCWPLWLEGWSDRSVWGYDESLGSYFAQLWADGADAEEPQAWIGCLEAVYDMAALARAISLVSGVDPRVALVSMQTDDAP